MKKIAIEIPRGYYEIYEIEVTPNRVWEVLFESHESCVCWEENGSFHFACYSCEKKETCPVLQEVKRSARKEKQRKVIEFEDKTKNVV